MPIKVIDGLTPYAVTDDPNTIVYIPDTWSATAYINGCTLLTADGKSGEAIMRLVQGLFTSKSTAQDFIIPATFGGITPNNDANQYAQVVPGQYNVTTTMPNQQASLVNYVYSVDGVFISEIVTVIDDNTILIKDPGQAAASAGNITIIGLSTNSYPLRNGNLYVDERSTVAVVTPGQQPVYVNNQGDIPLNQNNYGEVEPIMVLANLGTAVLTYNE